MQKIGTKSAVVSGVVGVLVASTVAVSWVGGVKADTTAKGERHPELRHALRSLRTAKADLQKAAHDFAGHREKALDLTDQAITEVEAALKADPK